MPADRAVRIDHVGFGLVLGEDGKKFRSRSGDVSREAGRERVGALVGVDGGWWGHWGRPCVAATGARSTPPHPPHTPPTPGGTLAATSPSLPPHPARPAALLSVPLVPAPSLL